MEKIDNIPEVIEEIVENTCRKLEKRPKLQQLFRNCFPNTLRTTTRLLEDGSTFVFTGDIPAMWLRDSVEQVRPYLRFLSKDDELKKIVRGLIQRHVFYINHDPYTNAFNESPNNAHWNDEDKAEMTPWVWERKYELDSLCFSLTLILDYCEKTGDRSVLDKEFFRALENILYVWEIEQNHFEQSTYTFERENCPDIDTLKNKGRGMPVNYTGMTWSGFRPSDDACLFGYHIPSNMFAVVVLGRMRELLSAEKNTEGLLSRMGKIQKEIDDGIQTYGTYLHPDHGRIYAYETDGFGNYALMDDAGTPSLLSIPYLGYRGMNDRIYQNTRKFALSEANPYYYKGQYARGLGSPHTLEGYVWHIGLAMQIMTTEDKEEIKDILIMLENTDADCGFMHESFHPDSPQDFTREWFAWSDSMCASAIMRAIDKGVI